MKRAVRRHHYERLKKKRRNYWGGKLNPDAHWFKWIKYLHEYGDTEEERGRLNRLIGIAVNTPTPCSEYCCGNPRKHYGMKSRQEVMGDIELREQLINR